MQIEGKMFKSLSDGDITLATKKIKLKHAKSPFCTSTTPTQNFFKNSLKILSCEDLDSQPSTFIFDQMMKKRKNWVCINFFLVPLHFFRER